MRAELADLCGNAKGERKPRKVEPERLFIGTNMLGNLS